MAYINEILQHLSDGGWHNLVELSRAMGIPFEQLSDFIRFLSKYGLVEIDDNLINVKMKPDFRTIVTEEKEPGAEKPERLLTIRGDIKAIEHGTGGVTISGAGLEVEEMGRTKPAEAGTKELLDMLRLLVESSWYYHNEMFTKLQSTTEKLVDAIKALSEKRGQ